MAMTPDTERLLKEYLDLKGDERKKGYTNEQVIKAVKNLATNLNEHIAADEREFKRIHEVLDTHNDRIRVLEVARNETHPIPTGVRESLVPPDVTDTGSYRIDPKNWSKVTAYVDDLQKKELINEGVKKQLKESADEAERKAERAEKKFEFWMKVGGAFVAIVTGGTAFYEYVAHHWH